MAATETAATTPAPNTENVITGGKVASVALKKDPPADFVPAFSWSSS